MIIRFFSDKLACISGVELGNTKLIFTAASNDEDVDSAPVDLQVFQPLKLNPRNGTILLGSSIQVVIKGGPQPDTEIVFTVINNKTASKFMFTDCKNTFI